MGARGGDIRPEKVPQQHASWTWRCRALGWVLSTLSTTHSRCEQRLAGLERLAVSRLSTLAHAEEEEEERPGCLLPMHTSAPQATEVPRGPVPALRADRKVTCLSGSGSDGSCLWG